MNPRPPVEAFKSAPPRTLFRRTLPHSRGRISPQSRVQCNVTINGAELALRVACKCTWCARRSECQYLFSVGWPRGPTSSIRGPCAVAPTISRQGHASQQICSHSSAHSEQVSWFISCSPTQSLYPGRPRGGLTIVPSRYPQQWAPTFPSRRLSRSVSFEALSGLAVPPPALTEQAPTPQPHRIVL